MSRWKVAVAAHALTASIAALAGPATAAIVDPPPFDPPPVLDTGTVTGTVRLRPAGHDFRWCGSLQVTATLKWIGQRLVCTGSGLTRSCETRTVVLDQREQAAVAQPTANDRSVWSYAMVLPTADSIELRAACAPAYDYTYVVKPARTWAQGFPLARLEAVRRNFALKLKVPAPAERVAVLPAVNSCSNWQSHAWDSADCDFRGGDCLSDPPYDAPKAGFASTTETSFAFAHQVLADFDLRPIDAVAKKVVLGAELSYRELVYEVRDADGTGDFASSCANHLGAPTVDWTYRTGAGERTVLGFVPAESLGDELRVGGDTRWNVTQKVTRWLARLDENHGFVLKGDNETFPQNDSACLSLVWDLYLTVRYLALPDVPEVF